MIGAGTDRWYKTGRVDTIYPLTAQICDSPGNQGARRVAHIASTRRSLIQRNAVLCNWHSFVAGRSDRGGFCRPSCYLTPITCPIVPIRAGVARCVPAFACLSLFNDSALACGVPLCAPASIAGVVGSRGWLCLIGRAGRMKPTARSRFNITAS
jgi:hypothetical protein